MATNAEPDPLSREAVETRLQLLGRFAAEAAHDLGHWLTIVLQAAEAIEQRAACRMATDASETASDAAAIRAAGLRGAELVRQIVALGGGTARGQGPVAVDPVLATTTHLARRLFGRRHDIALDLGARGGWVPLAEGALDRVVLNLLANARDAQPEGGPIIVRSRREAATSPDRPERIVVEVQDNGCGIPADVAARMFEPYFTTRSGHGGSGLGLASVRAVIESGGGHVHAENALPRGTRFVIDLPTCPAGGPPTSGPPEEAGTAARAGHPRRGVLLLVDDDDALRRLATRQLERQGWHVLGAASGEAALQRVGGNAAPAIAAVVADLELPGMDGVRLVHMLRSRLGRPRLPAAITSGHAEAVIRAAEAKCAAGPSALLPKPYGLDDLSRLLERLVPAAPMPGLAYSENQLRS